MGFETSGHASMQALVRAFCIAQSMIGAQYLDGNGATSAQVRSAQADTRARTMDTLLRPGTWVEVQRHAGRQALIRQIRMHALLIPYWGMISGMQCVRVVAHKMHSGKRLNQGVGWPCQNQQVSAAPNRLICKWRHANREW